MKSKPQKAAVLFNPSQGKKESVPAITDPKKSVPRNAGPEKNEKKLPQSMGGDQTTAMQGTTSLDATFAPKTIETA